MGQRSARLTSRVLGYHSTGGNQYILRLQWRKIKICFISLYLYITTRYMCTGNMSIYKQPYINNIFLIIIHLHWTEVLLHVSGCVICQGPFPKTMIGSKDIDGPYSIKENDITSISQASGYCTICALLSRPMVNRSIYMISSLSVSAFITVVSLASMIYMRRQRGRSGQLCGTFHKTIEAENYCRLMF